MLPANKKMFNYENYHVVAKLSGDNLELTVYDVNSREVFRRTERGPLVQNFFQTLPSTPFQQFARPNQQVLNVTSVSGVTFALVHADETLKLRLENHYILAQLRSQKPILTDSGRVNRDYYSDGRNALTGQNQAGGVNHVNFTQPFTIAPTVHVGIVGIDLDHGANQRLKVFAQNITTTGFDMVFSTWANTKVWGVEASWLAIGK